MQRHLEIEKKMEHWRNDYNKKDKLCKAFLKKKPGRRKKRESEGSSENFEIVIENAETSEVKSFIEDNRNTNINYSKQHTTKNIHFETDILSKPMSSGSHSNEEMSNANMLDFDDQDSNKNTVDGNCQTGSEVENFFDKNGNEIVVKAEPDEQYEQNDSSNVGFCEVKESTNDSSPSKLNDSELWYIAAGYDFDMTNDNKKKETVHSFQTEHTKTADDENDFDITNIKIKEESVCSIKEEEPVYNIKEDGSFENGPLIHNNGIRVENCNNVNRITTLLERVEVSGNIEKESEDEINVKEKECESSTSLTGSFGVKKLTASHAFPNLTNAIKNKEARSSSQMEKYSPSTSNSCSNKLPESDTTLCNHSENVDTVRENTETSVTSTMGNKQYSAWRKVQESAAVVENEVKSPAKVKFTLKKQHVVKSKYNALGNIDTPISKDSNGSKYPSMVGSKSDNEKSLVHSHQLSMFHRCVNRKTKTCEATNKSDDHIVDKAVSLKPNSDRSSLKKIKRKSDSYDKVDREHYTVDEADNPVHIELHKAEDDDDDDIKYNYVMLDGIMSLTLTGKDEIDQTTHSNETTSKTNMSSPGNDSCSLHMSVTSHFGADTDVSTESGSISSTNETDSGEIRNEDTANNVLNNINQETESGDHLSIESLSRITLVDDVFTTEEYGMKAENKADIAEEGTCNVRNVFQVNLNYTPLEDASDLSEQGEETSYNLSENELKSEKTMGMFNNVEESSVKDEEVNFGFGLKIPLYLPEPLENTYEVNEHIISESNESITHKSNENSASVTIDTYDNDKCLVSDNSTGLSDNEDDDDNDSSTCESYRIIQRYVFDRCTGNTIQKILVVSQLEKSNDHNIFAVCWCFTFCLQEYATGELPCFLVQNLIISDSAFG